MNSTVKDAIKELVAAEERVVDPPSGLLGYGGDIICETDLDPQLAEYEDPFDPTIIAHAIIRRFDTPRGSLPDDDDYGLGLVQMLNKGIDASELPELSGRMRLECLKDDRVEDVIVSLDLDPTPPAYIEARLELSPRDPQASAFSLTFVVTPESISVTETTSAPVGSLGGFFGGEIIFTDA